jgi:hypothetical protein
MTEEQRWKLQYQIEVDRNKCLKGIWDELKDIKEFIKAAYTPTMLVSDPEKLREVEEALNPSYICGVDLANEDLS